MIKDSLLRLLNSRVDVFDGASDEDIEELRNLTTNACQLLGFPMAGKTPEQRRLVYRLAYNLAKAVRETR